MGKTCNMHEGKSEMYVMDKTCNMHEGKSEMYVTFCSGNRKWTDHFGDGIKQWCTNPGQVNFLAWYRVFVCPQCGNCLRVTILVHTVLSW